MNQEELIRKTVEAVLGEAPPFQNMNLKVALALMERVEKKAQEMGLSVVVAVSDKAGRPVAVHCMDGAYIGSYDVAVNKAYTSVAFRMPTRRLGELSVPGGDLYGIQHTNDGKIVIFGGGEPLLLGGKMVGSLGVSGGTSIQDSSLAEYGKEVFKEVVSCQ